MQHTTPGSLPLEPVSSDLLELVQGGCHHHRRCCCPQSSVAQAPGVSGPVYGQPGGAPIFQQIMQIPAQLLQGFEVGSQQPASFAPSQFAAQSQPQSSGGEVQTSVQVGQA